MPQFVEQKNRLTRLWRMYFRQIGTDDDSTDA